MSEKPVSSNPSATTTARESLAYLSQISRLLNTGLDAEGLALCVRLCEAGVHPEALACAIREVRREVAALKRETTSSEDSSERHLL